MLRKELINVERYQGEKYEYTYRIYHDKSISTYTLNKVENAFTNRGLILSKDAISIIATSVAKGCFIDAQNDFMDIVLSEIEDIREEINNPCVYNNILEVGMCLGSLQ